MLKPDMLLVEEDMPYEKMDMEYEKMGLDEFFEFLNCIVRKLEESI